MGEQENLKQNSLVSKAIALVLPQILVAASFYVILYSVFPKETKEQVLRQTDIIQFQGMAKEIKEHRREYNEEPLWVSSLFSGMPAYQVSTKYTGDWFYPINQSLLKLFPNPINFIFLIFLGFFFLLQTLKVDVSLSGLGASAYAFSSYFFIILEAGHTSKALAIVYVAPVLAGVIMAFRGKVLLGSIITAFFLAAHISANHLQITYYLALMIIIFGIIQLIFSFINRTLPEFAKASIFLLLAAFFAIGPNFARLWTTYEYAEDTIRGKSELTSSEDKNSGLNIDYAFQWSYGVDESFTLMIPNFKGGATPDYWGTQPFTSGPVYVGAIVCFIFVLGLFIVKKDPLWWWLVIISILALMLSWGNNFLSFNELFFNNVPLYNKFRAVTIILVVVQLTFPLLGILALKEIDRNIIRLANYSRVRFKFRITVFLL